MKQASSSLLKSSHSYENIGHNRLNSQFNKQSYTTGEEASKLIKLSGNKRSALAFKRRHLMKNRTQDNEN